MALGAPLEWLDISDETSRTYYFPNGQQFTILDPQKLNVKAKVGGDSHRVIAKDGSYYIPSGWLAIRWKVKDGAAPVAF